MKDKLVIECKGIANISAISRGLEVELEQVDMSFLEDIKTETIVNNHNNEKLLEAMDTDELIEYVLNNVEIKNQLATSLGMV